MKHLKTLGLAILALVAVSALSGVASASAAEFHASAVGVAIHGEQVTAHKFTITGSSVTCERATFTGTTEALNSTTQKVHPSYEHCTAFGFAGAIVNTTGCQYNFHTQTGTVDLESCTNGGITIEVNAGLGKCITKIPSQTGILGQSFATVGTSPSRDITETTKATNIAAETVTSTGLCPLTVGKDTGGTYTGTTTMKVASGEIWYS
jgi:hypothetical protein